MKWTLWCKVLAARGYQASKFMTSIRCPLTFDNCTSTPHARGPWSQKPRVTVLNAEHCNRPSPILCPFTFGDFTSTPHVRGPWLQQPHVTVPKAEPCNRPSPQLAASSLLLPSPCSRDYWPKGLWVCCSWQSARPGQHARASEQAQDRLSPGKDTCDKQVPSWRHISCHTDKNRYYTWS